MLALLDYETGDGGTLGVVFIDDSTFSLGGSARMTVDEFVYDPASQSGSSSISIVQGVFTFVSGQIAAASPDAMTVSTPVITIGIRGTRVAGVAAAEGEENTVTLLPDENGVVGEIAITNGSGVTVVLNVANQSIQATSFTRRRAIPSS